MPAVSLGLQLTGGKLELCSLRFFLAGHLYKIIGTHHDAVLRQPPVKKYNLHHESIWKS